MLAEYSLLALFVRIRGSQRVRVMFQVRIEVLAKLSGSGLVMRKTRSGGPSTEY